MDTNYISKASGSFESFDGTTLYYEERGAGRPMVFVYGIACLINHWHFQLEYFSKDYRTVSYDLRGHHRSNPVPPNSRFDMESLARDLTALLNHLDLTDVILVGHSFGVPISIEAYKIVPDRISNLVFINGFSRNPFEHLLGQDLVLPVYQLIKTQYEKNRMMWDLLWKSAVDNPLSIMLAGVLGGFNLNLTRTKDIEIYLKGVASLDLNVFIAMFEEILRYDGAESLRGIRVPTLVFSGELDRLTPTQLQKKMCSEMTASEHTELKYGSHCCQLDFPEYINLKIEHFLKSAATQTSICKSPSSKASGSSAAEPQK